MLFLGIYTVKWCETLRTGEENCMAYCVFVNLTFLHGVSYCTPALFHFFHYSPGILCPKPTSSSHIAHMHADTYMYVMIIIILDSDVMYYIIVYNGCG